MKKVIATIMLLIIAITIVNIPYSYAGDIDIGKYKDIYQREEGIFDMGGQFLFIVQIIGYGIATVTLLIMGIKYIVSSPNEKADLKGKLIPYLIGAILLFAATTFISIISKFALSF